jgi:arylsulfatase A-like enzyme
MVRAVWGILLGCVWSVPLIAAERPNVVVILADDMGFADLGCYGGEIETLHLDQLAAGGLRFAQFYNTARCCPTRAALLTGLYSHQAGIGHMTGDDGIPAYRGYLNQRCVTIAEAVRPTGYATCAVGKWHVGSAPGHWPLDRGFDRFWGTPSGGGVYFKDTLQLRKEIFFTSGNQRIEPPDDLYVTDTFTDHALEFIEEAVTQTQRPFFLYLPHIAPHWPLQAKAADIAKYEGRYRLGWDALRQARLDKQVRLGIVPAGTQLSPRDAKARAWEEVGTQEREELARRMSIYAAQIDCIDQNVGRLVAKLKALGVLENTLIMFLSDNGCSAEGGPGGFSRGIDGAEIGAGLSYASAGLEWANACNTPYRRYKIDTHEGGIRTPLIVHWPAGVAARGQLRQDMGHVVDLMPTILQATGTRYPQTRNENELLPLEGISLLPAFAGEPLPERWLFWEHEGNKAVRHGNWKAVAKGTQPWQLYDLQHDSLELHNLAELQPQRLAGLVEAWTGWAERCGVWEWDDLLAHRQQATTRGKRRATD